MKYKNLFFSFVASNSIFALPQKSYTFAFSYVTFYAFIQTDYFVG